MKTRKRILFILITLESMGLISGFVDILPAEVAIYSFFAYILTVVIFGPLSFPDDY